MSTTLSDYHEDRLRNRGRSSLRSLREFFTAEPAEGEYERCMSLYLNLVMSSPKTMPRNLRTPFQKISAYARVCEAFFRHSNQVESLCDELYEIVELMTKGKFENDGKRWSDEEDQRLVEMKCEGMNSVVIAADLGRSPAAVATRLSVLVGKKRLFVNVDGRFVGTLDGVDTVGHVEGKVART